MCAKLGIIPMLDIFWWTIMIYKSVILSMEFRRMSFLSNCFVFQLSILSFFLSYWYLWSIEKVNQWVCWSSVDYCKKVDFKLLLKCFPEICVCTFLVIYNNCIKTYWIRIPCTFSYLDQNITSFRSSTFIFAVFYYCTIILIYRLYTEIWAMRIFEHWSFNTHLGVSILEV